MGWRSGGCDDGRMGWLSGGDVLVVETEEDWFVGSVEARADVLVVRSGYAGRPVLVPHEDVVRVTPVSEHDDEL